VPDSESRQFTLPGDPSWVKSTDSGRDRPPTLGITRRAGEGTDSNRLGWQERMRGRGSGPVGAVAPDSLGQGAHYEIDRPGSIRSPAVAPQLESVIDVTNGSAT